MPVNAFLVPPRTVVNTMLARNYVALYKSNELHLIKGTLLPDGQNILRTQIFFKGKQNTELEHNHHGVHIYISS